MRKNMNMVLAMAAALVLAACGSSGEAGTTQAYTETVSKAETQKESAGEIPGKTADETAQETESSQNPQAGDTITTDIFEFTVTNAYVLDDLGPNKQIPQGAVYAVVEYEFKNVSRQPVGSSYLPEVYLTDRNGAVYNEDSDDARPVTAR